jgi:hypothetical protein
MTYHPHRVRLRLRRCVLSAKRLPRILRNAADFGFRTYHTNLLTDVPDAGYVTLRPGKSAAAYHSPSLPFIAVRNYIAGQGYGDISVFSGLRLCQTGISDT